MIYQLAIVAGLLFFLVNLYLNLSTLKRPRRHSRLPIKPPFVSVLIPARDEEDNIGACLKSLEKQDYPNYEILVLDDNSSDDTSAIVEERSASGKRLKLLKGEPLPEGWAGKPFACYQLARHAGGDWLLFVDADTTHAPHMLSSVMDVALNYRPALLSGFPRQLASALPQKVMIPLIYYVIFCLVPWWWLQQSSKPKPGLAIGQFLLFPKEAYWRIDGHRAVKSRIMEDVWLGVEITRHGGRHLVIDLSDVVFCEMYRFLGTMREGFVKWMYSVAALSPAALVGLLATAYFFLLAPFYWLYNGVVNSSGLSSWLFVIILQVAIIFTGRRLVDNRFKVSWVSTALHPVGFACLFILAVYGGWQRVVGTGVSWKKRLYKKESYVD